MRVSVFRLVVIAGPPTTSVSPSLSDFEMAAMQPATRQPVEVVPERPWKARLESLSSRFHWFLDTAPDHLENMVCSMST